MRIRYTPRAFADREAIFEYLNRQSPQAARNVKAFIADKIASLSSSPRRARFVKELGVHALWLGRYPYIIYYRVSGDVVSIIHIRHGARRPWTGGND
ncbi:MAG: toxin ParE1/3/4 [Hyphomicrobiales bacterium]|jgi:plasmid stabilization system protein ParE|nr:toxin ParE1/3/4 [Hyphomicrobiales bacterium]